MCRGLEKNGMASARHGRGMLCVNRLLFDELIDYWLFKNESM
jgi:hypothetical protein